MKKILSCLSILILTFVLLACESSPSWDQDQLAKDNPRYDTYYQLFIRSFADSNNDGIGDFNGVTENLSYLKDLGVTAIWMLPYNLTDTDFLSYHGYRIEDYYKVNPEYGTIEDLENLIIKAKEIGIKITMDLVINHTSDKHPWYLNASSSTTANLRNYYVWTSDTTAFESFPGGMKDLNLNNPEVVIEIKNIIKFWIDKGIEGFRFDAAKHLFLGDPGSLPSVAILKNHAFLRELRTYARTLNSDILFLGEVFEYEYSAYKDYYKGLDSLFDFFVAKEIWNKIGLRTSTHLFVSNMKRAYETYNSINNDAVPSLFIGNHDIDRVASRGEYSDVNGLAKLKQSASVLLTLPGTPHIYYGDELGMKGISYTGENLTGQGPIYDQYRRAPFIWGDSDKETTWLNTYGNSKTAPSVKDSLSDKDSLLNHYKTFANLRLNHPALRYGNTLNSYKGNSLEIQGYVRDFSQGNMRETLLVLHNMSSRAQSVNVDYLSYVYGNSLTIEAYGTLILKIDSSQIQNYM